MGRKYFGTDGIRGKANEGNMTPEVAFRLGAAVTYQARKRNRQPRIVIGKDTRLSSYMIEYALTAGCAALGGRVWLTGPLPTPAIAHLTQSMRADAGFVISASHNPFYDNGLKIFGPDGFKLPDEQEEELEALMESDALDKKRPVGRQVGRAMRIDSAEGRYVQFVKSTFPADLTLDGMKIVVDAANGAAYKSAPDVFSELGATVYPIGVHPNGRNINADRGAVHPESCAKEVKRRHADIGIALDGDADRVVVVDERGRQVNGDAVMALCATRMLRNKTLRKRTLVSTVMSGIGLEHAMKEAGGKLVRAGVGDRYVVESMRQHGYNFGGEQSGHLVFLDHATTGDGLLGALQTLAIILREQRPLSELVDEVFQEVPQVLVNVTLPNRLPLSKMPKTRAAISDAESALGNGGRVLVRWSGTEPKLRIMVEGPTKGAINKLARGIAKTAQAEIS
ncbi:MAG: phosphoglucosamine mutase [Myxococcales bacterium]|nr:phosphoglucosamine mutase [Myxococcales bacterium]MDD9964850.1 phosphoglucosamine mutase [Myxococcales bacterium]